VIRIFPDDVTNAAMAAETRFEGDPKQEQKEDADLQQVVSCMAVTQ
jgi:hypothetical protein